MRILVVDDERAVREALERALRLEGYDVSLAADGPEALASISAAAPDAVVLDVLMPGLDGRDVCRTPEQVLPRDVIFDRIWGYDFGPTSNSLEVYVGYLRRKTEAGGEPRLIQTVRGVGYVLRGR